jgi:ABC-type bacteriocin/lantibiotic exporter with double-glycine peptidase domain
MPVVDKPDPGPTACAPRLPDGIFAYVIATSWAHQLPLLALSVTVFLMEVVPLELQRRVVNNVVKHRPYKAILVLCAVYAAAVILQGSMKLGLNVYRAYVAERAKRDLRRCITERTSSREQSSAAQGTAVSLTVAEVEPIGNFVGAALSEPLLEAGILATVVVYVIHIDRWMGAVALALFLPQALFVPVMQRAMNQRTRARVQLLRQIGAGLIARSPSNDADSTRIDRVFAVDMGIFELKFSMNFLMNLCTHAQIVAALLLGGWRALSGDLEIGGVVAFIAGIGRLTDPWGDLVNYCRDLSVNTVRYNLLTAPLRDEDGALSQTLAAKPTPI